MANCEYKFAINTGKRNASILVCRVTRVRGRKPAELHCTPDMREQCAILFSRAKMNNISSGTEPVDLQFPDLREFHGDLEAFKIDASEIESQ